jgi:group I intron endonuclease
MIIYKTTNKINNKFYIGQDSKNDPNYFGSGVLLSKAIEKYGKENFIKEIIEFCETKEQLNEREIFWIEKTKAKEHGYNIADGGNGGNTYTEETKKRISEKFKGREVSKETVEKRKTTREKNPEKYKLSEERKMLIGNQHRGKVISDENKQKLSERMKNFDNYSIKFLDKQKGENKIGDRNPMWGKNHSVDVRNKMSESHKKNPVKFWEGKTRPPEVCKKTSETLKKRTPEQRLQTYIKSTISKTGIGPAKEKLEEKLQQYKDEYQC